MLETTELLSRILNICAQHQSGTLFLTTTDNKACHLVFESGQITAMAYGRVRGMPVADLLPRLSIQTCRFNSEVAMPLSSSAQTDQQADIFAIWGVRRRAVTMPPQASSSERFYRGHKVEHSDSKPDTTTETAPAENNIKSRKSKRIYRGQVIED